MVLRVTLYILLITVNYYIIFCNSETTCNDTNICLTPTCTKIASDLMDSIDFTKDPCDNFFDFACGKWIKNNIIPDERVDYSIGTIVEIAVQREMKVILENEGNNKSASNILEMTRNLYKTCVDTSKINKLKSVPAIDLLNKVGGWPILQNDWQDNGVDFVETMGKMIRDYTGQVFISATVGSNWRQPLKTAVYVDQAPLGIGADTRDYYLNDTIHKVHMDAYTKYIKDVLIVLAADMNVTKVNYSEVDDLVTFEKQLANITIPPEQRRNFSIMYNPMSVEVLSNILPSMKLKTFFQLILPKEVNDLVQNASYQLIVKAPKYMIDLQQLVMNSNKKTLLNYIVWRLFSPYIKYLDVRYEDIQQEYLKIMAGREAKPIRWKNCLDMTIRLLDLPSGGLYVREHFTIEDKNETIDMIQHLFIAMKGLINNSDWMDRDTKHKALLKISAMRNVVGYPDFLLDDKALDEYYKNMDYTPSDSYFEIAKRTLLWTQQKMFLDALYPFERNRFDLSPAVVNAYYSFAKNAINFPAAILKYPLFQNDLPKYINYGAAGFLIGHEITHGFDDKGSQYDNFGGLINWWSKPSLANFQKKADCMIKQYDKYVAPGTTTNISGRRTLSENIADNGGLKEAYMAYTVKQAGQEELRLPSLEKLTNEQMFFISFAYSWCGKTNPQRSLWSALTSAHSPDMYRVNGVLVNNEHFAKVFNCKQGSKMNPDPDKEPNCSVW